MKISFTADYNHRWPSGAVTAFKAGWSGPVKRVVADQAIAKGKATAIPRDDKAAPDDRRAGRVVRANTGLDGRGISGDASHAGFAISAQAKDHLK